MSLEDPEASYIFRIFYLVCRVCNHVATDEVADNDDLYQDPQRIHYLLGNHLYPSRDNHRITRLHPTSCHRAFTTFLNYSIHTFTYTIRNSTLYTSPCTLHVSLKINRLESFEYTYKAPLRLSTFQASGIFSPICTCQGLRGNTKLMN